MEDISASFLAFLGEGPLILVWIVGLIYSVSTWRSHPRVSLLMSIGLVILLVNALVGTFLLVVLPRTLISEGRSSANIGVIFGTIGLARSLMNAVAWGLCLWACFSPRDAPPYDPS